jgi:hypothetical protein
VVTSTIAESTAAATVATLSALVETRVVGLLVSLTDAAAFDSRPATKNPLPGRSR